MAFKSFAYSIPPWDWSSQVKVNFTTTDGLYSNNGSDDKVGSVLGYCMKWKAESAYGLITRCGQWKIIRNDSIHKSVSFRAVLGNLTVSKFQPDSNWYTYKLQSYESVGPNLQTGYEVCNNTDQTFADIGSASTAYGWLFFGSRFRVTIYGVWQTSFSIYSAVTGNCTTSTSDVWYNVKGSW